MINQLTASYNQNEDRVLFKFNTKLSEEYAFWLSRKVVKEIMNSMPRHTQEGLAVFQKIRNERVTKSAGVNKATEQKKMLQKENTPDLSHNKSGAVQKKDTFKPGETFPLGDAPILVVGFKQKEKDDKLVLDFFLIDGRNVSWRISNALFLKLHSLLEAVLVEADWEVREQVLPIGGRTGLN